MSRVTEHGLRRLEGLQMLGIVPDDIFDRELGEAQQIGTIKDIMRGRGARSEVPEVIREIIAEDAIASNMTARELSEKHEISQSSISAYKHGSTSTASYDEPIAELLESNNRVRKDIISNARSRLVSALQHITPDKLSEAKLRDVASVAKDMSAIIKNMEPEVKDIPKERAPQFIFFAPQPVKEDIFDTVYTKE